MSIKLHKNMDINQPVLFRDINSMKKCILKDPFAYDGLCLFDEDGEPIVNLRYIDVYHTWEVEEAPAFESDSMTLKEAVNAFADCVITGVNHNGR